MNNKLITNPHSALEMIIVKERLRQSRYSFNAALAARSEERRVGKEC